MQTKDIDFLQIAYSQLTFARECNVKIIDSDYHNHL